jgi:hypothetical protein
MLKQALPGVDRPQRGNRRAAAAVTLGFVVGWIALALASLVGLAADLEPGAMAKDGSAIHLSEDFRLAELRAMSRAASRQSRIARRDYPTANAVEWQVRLKALEGGDPPLWENPRSAGFVAAFPFDAPVSPHWNRGSHESFSNIVPRDRKALVLQYSPGAMPHAP